MGLIPTQKTIIGQYINGRNAADDFLQLANNHGGHVFGWIDADGTLQGSLASVPLTWDQIGNAASPLTLANGTNPTTFNQTNSAAWTWANTTSATSPATNQSSPIFTLAGTSWSGSVSNPTSISMQAVVGIVGNNAGAALSISGSGNFGGVIVNGNVNCSNFFVGGILSSQSSLNAGNINPLTSAANASAGNTTYQGGFAGTVAIPGMTVVIAGFVNGANNGTFVVQAGSTTQIIVNNPSGVAETHAGTATYTNPYGGTGTITFSGSGLGSISVQGTVTPFYTALTSNVQGISAVINCNSAPNDAGFLQAYALANKAHGFQIGAIYDGTGANPGFLNWGLNAAGGHVLNLTMPDGITGVTATGTLFTSASVGTVALQASTGSSTKSISISGSTGVATSTAELVYPSSHTGNAAFVQSKTVTLSSAQILSLGTVPVQLLPSPGANKTYAIQNILAHYRFGGTPYTQTSFSFAVATFTNTSGAQDGPWGVFTNTSFLGTSADAYAQGGGQFNGSANAVNLPLYLSANASPTLGNGTVTLTIYYSIVDVTVT